MMRIECKLLVMDVDAQGAVRDDVAVDLDADSVYSGQTGQKVRSLFPSLKYRHQQPFGEIL
jgi:hypothetical protein